MTLHYLHFLHFGGHESAKSAESANVYKERQKPICMKKKGMVLGKRMEWKTKEKDGLHS